jgi:hypothetical protein
VNAPVELAGGRNTGSAAMKPRSDTCGDQALPSQYRYSWLWPGSGYQPAGVFVGVVITRLPFDPASKPHRLCGRAIFRPAPGRR